MGQMISSQINMCIIEYLKSLLNSGQDSYTIDKFEKDFFLNGSPRSPKCHLCVINSSIACLDELHMDDSAAYTDQPIRVKALEIEIEIGEAVVSCDKLGYSCSVSGTIKIYDLILIAAITPVIDDSLQIEDYDSKVKVRKIKSDIKLSINGSDHSDIANAILSTTNPDLANTILNTVLMLHKETIKDFLNSQICSGGIS